MSVVLRTVAADPGAGIANGGGGMAEARVEQNWEIHGGCWRFFLANLFFA